MIFVKILTVLFLRILEWLRIRVKENEIKITEFCKEKKTRLNTLDYRKLIEKISKINFNKIKNLDKIIEK